jgi:acetyl esterase
MAIDDATAAMLGNIAAQGGPPLHELAPADMRAMGAAFAALAGPPLDMNDVSDTSHGDIALRVLRPVATPVGVIVWFHGGGWTFGNIDDADPVARRLAAATRCTVVVVDYRLAPEHPHPAAADDAIAATAWAIEHLGELASAGAPLLVGGDSAGGNLAAVVTHHACAAGWSLAGQVLVQPVTDCDFDTASYTDPDNQLVLDRNAMQRFWDFYVPDASKRTDPTASPLRATDFAGLPAAVVVTSEHDPLRDDGEAYAARLTAAGVPVDHRRFEGQMHGFFLFPLALPVADDALAFVADFVTRTTSAAAA